MPDRPEVRLRATHSRAVIKWSGGRQRRPRSDAGPAGQRARYEVIFALPVLIPFPDDYAVTHYVGEHEPPVTVIRFRWGQADDSRPYGAITAVTREAWGTHVSEIGPHQAYRDRDDTRLWGTSHAAGDSTGAVPVAIKIVITRFADISSLGGEEPTRDALAMLL